MKHRTPAVATAALLALLGIEVSAEDPSGIRPVDPAAVSLRPHPRFDGVSNGPVTGNPAERGLYAGTGLMRAGSVFAPHTHPDRRLTVVLSGTMYLGEGDTVDEASLVAYPAGTTAVTEPNTMHYMIAKDEDVRLLEIGAGPSGVSFAREP